MEATEEVITLHKEGDLLEVIAVGFIRKHHTGTVKRVFYHTDRFDKGLVKQPIYELEMLDGQYPPVITCTQDAVRKVETA